MRGAFSPRRFTLIKSIYGTPWLDGRHVVFGKITSGMDVVEAMEEQGSRKGRTKTDVMMSDCRVL